MTFEHAHAGYKNRQAVTTTLTKLYPGLAQEAKYIRRLYMLNGLAPGCLDTSPAAVGITPLIKFKWNRLVEAAKMALEQAAVTVNNSMTEE